MSTNTVQELEDRVRALGAARRGVIVAALGIALAGVLFAMARCSGAATSAHAITAALDTNARQLNTARAHQDTTKRVAIAATAHVNAERDTTRAIERAVEIVSADTVQLATADSIYRAGVPPLVVTELEQDRAQIRDDSLAINLWIANDSAQTDIITRLDERTQLLEGAVKSESRAAYWRGAKVGAAVVAVIALVLRFAR